MWSIETFLLSVEISLLSVEISLLAVDTSHFLLTVETSLLDVETLLAVETSLFTVHTFLLAVETSPLARETSLFDMTCCCPVLWGSHWKKLKNKTWSEILNAYYMTVSQIEPLYIGDIYTILREAVQWLCNYIKKSICLLVVIKDAVILVTQKEG